MSAKKFLNAFYTLREWLEENQLLQYVESITIKMKGHNLSFMAADDLLRGRTTAFTKDGIKPHEMGGHRMREFNVLGIPFMFQGEVGGGAYKKGVLPHEPVYVVIEQSELNELYRKARLCPPTKL